MQYTSTISILKDYHQPRLQQFHKGLAVGKPGTLLYAFSHKVSQDINLVKTQ